MSNLFKAISIIFFLNIQGEADTFKLTCAGQTIVMDQVQQFAIGEILVLDADSKSSMRGKYAELWVSGGNIQLLNNFTSRFKGQKIEVSFGDLILSNMRILSAIEDGHITFYLRDKQIDTFKLAMEKLEKSVKK